MLLPIRPMRRRDSGLSGSSTRRGGSGTVARIDFQAKLQEDVRASYPDAPGLKDPITGETQTFEFHRNRIGIQGNLFRHIEFEIERELTEKELTEKDVLAGVTPNRRWKDVYVNVSYIDDAQIQVGKFKIPFGLDQLTGVANNDFVYRSLGARYLAPSRDIGVMVHGRFFRRGLSYWTGVFRTTATTRARRRFRAVTRRSRRASPPRRSGASASPDSNWAAHSPSAHCPTTRSFPMAFAAGR